MKQSVISEERFEELRGRSERCVCKYCGGKLEVKLLNFGQIETANMELFCTTCNRIEYGTEPEIYRNAVYYVDAMGFNAFPDREPNEKTRKMNIGKVCDIISWHDRQIGLLNEQGYKIPLEYDEKLLDGADGSSLYYGSFLEERGDSF